MLIGMSCINMEQCKWWTGLSAENDEGGRREGRRNEKKSMNDVGLTKRSRPKYTHTNTHKQKVAAHGQWRSRREIKRYLETHCCKERWIKQIRRG